MQDDDRQPAAVVQCPNCGASNPAGSPFCASCGSRLSDPEQPDEETVIDVSSGQPRILEEEQPTGRFGGRIQGGFTTVRFDQGRAVVSQGNRLTCFLVLLSTVLFVCCSCWFFWWIPARLF